MTSIEFFNDRNGVGKTTLAHHLAWMFADLGLSVLVADLDPEANLSSLFLDENSLEEIWSQRQTPRTILGGLMPLVQGSAEGPVPWIARIAPGIGL